jgi:vacuolar-type H+-ATPase subunit I/STV1
MDEMSAHPSYPPAPEERLAGQGAPQPESGPPKKWHQKAGWRFAIVVLVVVLVGAWRAGSFDHALVNVGLNAKECARNGFGATFCGEELDEAREHQRQVSQELEKTKEEANRAAEKAKQESEEVQAKLNRESEAAQAQLNRESAESQRQFEEAQREAEG